MFLPLISHIPTLFSISVFSSFIHLFAKSINSLFFCHVYMTTSAMSASFHRLSTSHVLLRIISNVLSLSHCSLGPFIAAKYSLANPLIP